MTSAVPPDSLQSIRRRIRHLQLRRSIIELDEEQQAEYQWLLEAEAALLAAPEEQSG